MDAAAILAASAANSGHKLQILRYHHSSNPTIDECYAVCNFGADAYGPDLGTYLSNSMWIQLDNTDTALNLAVRIIMVLGKLSGLKPRWP